MNNTRRKAIADVKTQLRELWETIETLQREEYEYYDNMPESLQESDRCRASQEAAESLEEAAESLEDAITSLEDCN